MPGVPITPLTGRIAIVAMLIVLVAMASLARGGAAPERAASNRTYLNDSRTDMIASCRDQGAPRSYCRCLADRVLERNGRNVARLQAMEADVARLRPGSPPPTLLASATRACARA
jgi:hypothetical protein